MNVWPRLGYISLTYIGLMEGARHSTSGSLKRGQGRGRRGWGLRKIYWATNQGCSLEEEEEEDDGGGKYRGIFCNRKGKEKKKKTKKKNRKEKNRKEKKTKQDNTQNRKKRSTGSIGGIGSPAMIAHKSDAKL